MNERIYSFTDIAAELKTWSECKGMHGSMGCDECGWSRNGEFANNVNLRVMRAEHRLALIGEVLGSDENATDGMCHIGEIWGGAHDDQPLAENKS